MRTTRRQLPARSDQIWREARAERAVPGGRLIRASSGDRVPLGDDCPPAIAFSTCERTCSARESSAPRAARALARTGRTPSVRWTVSAWRSSAGRTAGIQGHEWADRMMSPLFPSLARRRLQRAFG